MVAVTEFMDRVIHNELFAECEVHDNFQGLNLLRSKDKTCKLVL